MAYSYDVTGICGGAFVLLLLMSYIGFAYLVTHSGDFYHIRRWKAAIWVGSIFGVMSLGALLVVTVIAVIPAVIDGKWNAVLETGRLMGTAALCALPVIVPFMFVVTWGMQHRLKWWLDSDDFLDKIWKDPNKGHRSPIQEI